MRALTLSLSLGLASCSSGDARPSASVASERPATSASPPPPAASASASAAASPAASASARDVGPFEVPFIGDRTVFYVAPASSDKPQRLLANLHGVCNPPGYACGYWSRAASEAGFLVCPTGNSRCGAGAYNAPTWVGSYEKMGDDLELAIARVEALHPGEIGREGAILTGFSRGAYAAVAIAEKNPGRWPYLILNEADVSLSASKLRASGVRAVALIAGERGSQIAGERRTAERLARESFAARLWVMPKAGHHYSANIDDIMREAIAWVLQADQPAAP